MKEKTLFTVRIDRETGLYIIETLSGYFKSHQTKTELKETIDFILDNK